MPLRSPSASLIGFILLFAVCAPFDRLAEFSQNGRAAATAISIINAGDYSVLAAYDRLERLPGYRLASKKTVRAGDQLVTAWETVSDYDDDGNSVSRTTTADGQTHETIVVAGEAYGFNPQYQGWVHLPGGAPLDMGPHRWLAQLGVAPAEAQQDSIQGRTATRYRLKYLAEALEPAYSGSKPQGMIWIDDETGALLKSQILLFERDQRRPVQEFTLEVSHIGQTQTVEKPAPIVNPAEIVAATATAQAWSVVKATVSYQAQPVSFEIVPVQVTQQAANTPPQAEMLLIFRSMPLQLLTAPEPDAFLDHLARQLTLSIPQNNVTAASTHFEAHQTDLQNRSIEVSYFFEVDLANSSHVELILASSGNPLFALVPVAAGQ